jgi:hypothetical protein
MSEVAWPFLIGRTRTEDHRFVVIPEFMTDPPLASALRASVSGDPMGPDSAAVREIQAAQGGIVTVVYRVSIARAEDYGIPDGPSQGMLTDSHGRPILITEGLVLRRAAADVIESGIPQAALDEVHALVAPAYREFWSADQRFARQVGHAFAMMSNGSPDLRLQLQPDTWALAPVRDYPGSQPSEPQGLEPVPIAPGITSGPRPADEKPPPTYDTPRYRRRPRAAVLSVTSIVPVLAVLVVIVFVALIAVKLLSSQSTSTSTSQRGAAQTMSDFCSDLKAGHPAAAYSLTTTGYQKRTSQQVFTSELLPKGRAATECTSVLHASRRTETVDATLALTQRNTSESWLVTLSGSISAPWQVTGISHAK